MPDLFSAYEPSRGDVTMVPGTSLRLVCLAFLKKHGSLSFCRGTMFVGTSTTNHQDRDVRQHGTPAFVKSFVATLGLLSMYGWDPTVNAAVRDAFQAPYHNRVAFFGPAIDLPHLSVWRARFVRSLHASCACLPVKCAPVLLFPPSSTGSAGEGRELPI